MCTFVYNYDVIIPREVAMRGEKNNSKDELKVPSLFGSGFKTKQMMCHDYLYDNFETIGNLNTV